MFSIIHSFLLTNAQLLETYAIFVFSPKHSSLKIFLWIISKENIQNHKYEWM